MRAKDVHNCVLCIRLQSRHITGKSPRQVHGGLYSGRPRHTGQQTNRSRLSTPSLSGLALTPHCATLPENRKAADAANAPRLWVLLAYPAHRTPGRCAIPARARPRRAANRRCRVLRWPAPGAAWRAGGCAAPMPAALDVGQRQVEPAQGLDAARPRHVLAIETAAGSGAGGGHQQGDVVIVAQGAHCRFGAPGRVRRS